MKANQRIVISAMYKFVRLPDYKAMQPEILKFCQAHGIRGTLLLAEEGINGTISGTEDAINQVLDFLKADQRFEDLEHKESYHDASPFLRIKVKLKKEIVTMGIPEIDPTEKVGTYLNATQWNEVISQDDVLLIDTRNDYEVDIGTFKGAVDPRITTFRDFPQYIRDNFDPQKHKRIAMFCTGGIRCEKATSFMLEEGYPEVYHLKGGILKYLEEMPEAQSLWEGECFVFDERISVKHGLEVGSYDQCHACRHPIDANDMASEHYVPGVSCPHCIEKRSQEQQAADAERELQMELAEQRGKKHLGAQMGAMQEC